MQSDKTKYAVLKSSPVTVFPILFKQVGEQNCGLEQNASLFRNIRGFCFMKAEQVF